MSGRGDLLAQADQMLRRADPLGSADLSRAHVEESAQDDLRRILVSPRERTRNARRSASRLLRPLIGLAGAAILVVVLGALLLHVRGDGDHPAADAVVAPPADYSALDRPYSGDGLELPDHVWSEPVVPDSIRLALSSGGDRWFLARTPNGRVVCLLYSAYDGGYSCGTGAASGSVAGGQAIGYRRLLSGAVPDGVTEVVVDGRTIPVEHNIYHLDLHPRVTRVSIDFRTEKGVIASWHEEMRLTASPGVLAPVRSFSARARAIMTRPPYVGVSCPQANSFACDRIGVSVWLRRPARHVVAKIGTHTVALDDPSWSGPAAKGLRRRFAGFLQPAGLIDGRLRLPVRPGVTRWLGKPPVTVRVRITAIYADGSDAVATTIVTLHPGWG